MSTVVCPECDLLQQRPYIIPSVPHKSPISYRLQCCRCEGDLPLPADGDTGAAATGWQRTVLALAVTALILFGIVNSYPIMTFSLNGRLQSGTVLDGVLALAQQGQPLLALLVAVTAFVVPLLDIVLLLGMGLVRTDGPMVAIQRWRSLMAPWNMSGIYLLGALVALVKLAHQAEAMPGVALYALAAMIVVLTLAAQLVVARPLPKALLLLLLLPIISGCAGTLRSYQGELNQVSDLTRSHQLGAALQRLEQLNDGTDKDLLYYFEKGELLRLQKQFALSQEVWLEADRRVRQWEEQARLDPNKVINTIGAVLINDKVLPYQGQDYEKVLLTARMAMNHVVQGDWAAARTEIKKTHEREAVIAMVQAKQMAQVEEEAQKRSQRTAFQDIQGYPVATLDDPEVMALKNGYQNAFSHYLSGFVYESLNEPSLAAPGYRQAIELRPDVPFLTEALRQLDSRHNKPAAGMTDVLFVVESGWAPARQSVMLPLPVPGVGVVSFSFPVLSSQPSVRPQTLLIDHKQSLPLASVTNIDAMARRALRDDMPGILLRSTIRAATKGVAQKASYDQHALLGLAVTLATLATESADERGWRLLPAQVSLARAMVPSGSHQITVTAAGGQQQTVAVALNGRYAIIPIRMLDHQSVGVVP
ncbi:MAG: paraquat-inducible protein A [Magnetococcales bacterium]|nr:paraquat-inducible protein A [Magnetococcales bacterium]